jgi:hypothetical protein
MGHPFTELPDQTIHQVHEPQGAKDVLSDSFIDDLLQKDPNNKNSLE